MSNRIKSPDELEWEAAEAWAKTRSDLVQVFSHKYPGNASFNDFERYQYGISRTGSNWDGFYQFENGALAFLATRSPVAGEQSLGVYLLRKKNASGAPYFKLSMDREDDGFTLLERLQEPIFYAFYPADNRPWLSWVYEHSLESPNGAPRRYTYDFNSEPGPPENPYSKGTPVFEAISINALEHVLSGKGKSEATEYALRWFAEHLAEISEAVKGANPREDGRQMVDKLKPALQGLPQPRYYSFGTGIHAGVGINSLGGEGGSIWKADDFGYVPMREPLTGYLVEWFTFGPATGVDIGVAGDLALVTWFGDLRQIEGACNGITMTAQFFAGVAVTLYWDGTWDGAQRTSHPIGVGVVLSAGIETGAGLFYNVSATQFVNHGSQFRQEMG